MSEEKDYLVTKLSLIKQYRSIGYIAELVGVESDVIKSWLDGVIDDDIVEDVNLFLDNEFNTELKISLDEDELLKVKDLIKNKIINIELQLGVQETLKVLGGVSIATFNRYKRGEIPMSNLLYIKSMVEDIQIDASTSENSVEGKSLSDKLKLKLNSDDDKKESELNESSKVTLRSKDTSISSKSKETNESSPKEVPVKKEINNSNRKEENKVSEKSEKNITKLVFNRVEEELKEILGDSIELKKVEFLQDKIILEVGIEED